MSHIFISYKSTERERVLPLVDLLNGQGWAVWWDRKIPPGKSFDQVIEEAIAAASCLVVVWSAESVTSEWVKTEAAEGVKRGILVPVLIDEAPIPLEFRRIQAAKLTDLPRPADDPDVQGLLASISRTFEHKRHQPQTDREAKPRGLKTSPGGKSSLRSAVLALATLVALVAGYFALTGGKSLPVSNENTSHNTPGHNTPGHNSPGHNTPGHNSPGPALDGMSEPRTEIQPDEVSFLGVDSGPETSQAEADEKTVEYFETAAKLTFTKPPCDHVVRRLRDWDRAAVGFLARVSPSVYLAAEMLGTDLEILATYQSKATRSNTHHSYFVVNRDDFAAQPALDDVLHLIRNKSEGCSRFVYHSKFSTSSYFLPSLFFRRHKIFNLEPASGCLSVIDSRESGTSSGELVRQVAMGKADLAAVWDGTRAKFEPGGENELLGNKVYFVQIDTPLPNDLLVSSRFLDSRTEEEIRQAISAMETDKTARINVGDFLWWKEWKSAIDAREALAALRWLATGTLIPEIAAVAEVEVVSPAAPRRGVTLYEDSDYSGDSEIFFEDEPDLRNSRIRNDRASSVRVPEGCTVTLYRHVSYQGRSSVLRSDTPELKRTKVGNDAVSSLKIECEAAGASKR